MFYWRGSCSNFDNYSYTIWLKLSWNTSKNPQRLLTFYSSAFWYPIFFQNASDLPRHLFTNDENKRQNLIRIINIFDKGNEPSSLQYKYLMKIKTKITIWHEIFSVIVNFLLTQFLCMIFLQIVISGFLVNDISAQ